MFVSYSMRIFVISRQSRCADEF